MASRILILLSLCFAPVTVSAENAADYLHRGAQKYIFGEEEAARSEVATGLQKFPTDEDLRRMATLLTKQQQPQQQDESDKGKDQQQQQDAEDQSKKDKQQEQGDEKDKPGSGPPQPDPQKNDGASPTPGPGDAPPTPAPDQQGEPSATPGENEEQDGDGDADGDGAGASPTPGASPRRDLRGEVKGAAEDETGEQGAAGLAAEPAGEAQMSPEQAERLLRAMRDEEQRVQLDERKASRRVYNDW